MQPLSVDLSVAMPLSIVVGELVSNAFGHAFAAGTSGTIRLETAGSGDRFRLVVADNGIGYPSEAESTGTGLGIARALCSQIDATLTIEADNGTRCTVRKGC
jgi:two-component sensor histidine kinase